MSLPEVVYTQRSTEEGSTLKQLFQNLKTGVAESLELPTPKCGRGTLLIQTHKSLISPGTERMLADFGKAGWISKARQQPEKVKMVLQKMRTDGVEATVKAVFNKLNQPLPVGYSNVGTVLEVGEGVSSFEVGDRVVSNGYHADMVVVPENLCARIPEGVSDEEASFTVLGAIALQGVRLAAPTLGETFCVYGLGLIGLLTCQILKANGCRVIGIDLSEARVNTAKEYGVEALLVSPDENPAERVIALNNGKEVDGVLLTASTRSNSPIESSPLMTRKRGRIVLVGVVGLNLERNEFFKKEITFQVSCSYGPGRYDDGYEQDGVDYPFGYVRWTEQRNFDAVLRLMDQGSLSVKDLITERIPFSSAEKAYDRILTEATGYGFLFNYPETSSAKLSCVELKESREFATRDNPQVSFIGSGNYARGVLLPAFQAADAKFSGIVSRSGVSSADLARKYSFQFAASEVEEVLKDKGTAGVVIATRHDSHASLVVQALEAGKHVFVEKPLGMNREELQAVRSAYEKSRSSALMVGFNRRYSALSQQLKKSLEGRTEPLSFRMSINAGAIPADHWTQKGKEGGGRVIGELCHFIDFAHFITDSAVEEVTALAMKDGKLGDTVTVALQFSDGSVGSIDYFANGHKSLPKERYEVFSSGKVLLLNNFLSLEGYGVSGLKKKKLWRQDKGQGEQAKLFLDIMRGRSELASTVAETAFESMETTFKVVDALQG